MSTLSHWVPRRIVSRGYPGPDYADVLTQLSTAVATLERAGGEVKHLSVESVAVEPELAPAGFIICGALLYYLPATGDVPDLGGILT